jgi:hypothetical protein
LALDPLLIYAAQIVPELISASQGVKMVKCGMPANDVASFLACLGGRFMDGCRLLLRAGKML